MLSRRVNESKSIITHVYITPISYASFADYKRSRGEARRSLDSGMLKSSFTETRGGRSSPSRLQKCPLCFECAFESGARLRVSHEGAEAEKRCRGEEGRGHRSGEKMQRRGGPRARGSEPKVPPSRPRPSHKRIGGLALLSEFHNQDSLTKNRRSTIIGDQISALRWFNEGHVCVSGIKRGSVSPHKPRPRKELQKRSLFLLPKVQCHTRLTQNNEANVKFILPVYPYPQLSISSYFHFP